MPVQQDFELKIREKKARVHISELPVIEGIGHQLSQLCYNLIDNALKFNNNKPEITITA
jgi:two-component system CheB/CheR fusion protein